MLSDWYKKKIQALNNKSLTKAQKIAQVAIKIKREFFFSELVRTNQHLIRWLKHKDILKMMLAILYLGEGSKWKSHRGLMLGSSDPVIIKLYIHLLNLCYGITAKLLRCRVSYRADQDIHMLQKYWSCVTLIPVSNFFKTIPDPRTIGRPTKKKEYKGVCVISCGGTHIQLELEKIPEIILGGL